MKNLITLFFFFLTGLAGLQAQNTLSGNLSNSMSQPVQGARVIVFNSDTSFFAETRSTVNGTYSFSSLPNGSYTIGVAQPGMEYEDSTLNLSSNLGNLDFSLQTENHPGEWNVLLNSPQSLGGTDLGILLPDGKIFYCHDTEDPFLFDPVTNQASTPTGYDTTQGCVGPLLLNSGEVIFIGGTDQQVYGPGIKKVKTYDPMADSWQLMPNLLDYRWYPTVAPLADGRILVTGGGGLQNPVRVNTTEIYDPATGQSIWADTIAIGNEVSPIVQLYNGKVLMTHRPPQLFDPTTNQWEPAADFIQDNRMPNGDHSDHELILLPNDDGRAVAIGHISFVPNQLGNLVEIYDPQNDSWSLGSNFAPMRSRAKMVLLPNRKIMVAGGYKEDQAHPAPVNQWGQLYLTDEYDPATDSWRRLDSLNYAREYHATTILVPDGRVITVGGEGQPGNEPPASIIEAFSPPYLFRGVRPAITSVSGSFEPGNSVSLDVAYADSVTAVRLISTASVTHFMNSGNNRFLELNFSQAGSNLSVQLPADSLSLPTGYYMLFVMVDDVPSVAEIVRVEEGTTVGINEWTTAQNQNLKIYPNPAAGRVQVALPKGVSSDVLLRLFDVKGRLWLQEQIQSSADSYVVDLSKVPAGIYFISLRADGKTWSSKIIVEAE